MPTIFDLVNAKEIGNYYTEDPTNAIPFLGEELFPPKKQVGLDLSWIKGHKGTPVALMPSNFDTKATIRDRIGVTKVETEMPFFREGMRIGEKDRQEINKLLGAGNQYLDPILENIFDDVANLVLGAKVQPERMRMQLLSTGTIAIQANRTKYYYDYKFDTNHKETLLSTAQWSDTANSKPLEDIESWQDTIENDTGVRPSRAICTRKTFDYIVKNQNVQAQFEKVARRKDVLEYISQELGLEIVIYNKKFTAEDGTEKNYFPDDVFTLLPASKLGNTHYGTTPEESDLMAGQTDADVTIVDTGVAITTLTIPHPVNVETIVSEIVLPSFESIDSIFIGEVAGN